MPHTRDEGVENIGLAGYRFAYFIARYLPETLSDGLAVAAGLGFSQLMRERRAIVARNLTRIDPTLRGARLDRAVRATFDSYSRYWIDSFRVPSLSAAAIDAGFAFRGYGRIVDALERGRGVILALPHLGGWEWAGRWMVDRGHKLTVVVEPIEPPELFEFFAQYRRSLGMTVVGLGPEAGPAVLQALAANEVVCLLCDRDIRGDGLPVKFFGASTTMPGGPAVMAFRSGAPIIPTGVYFTHRHNGHFADIRAPLATERRGRVHDDVLRVTRELTGVMEDMIRAAPDQWHMMQPVWPEDDGSGR